MLSEIAHFVSLGHPSVTTARLHLVCCFFSRRYVVIIWCSILLCTTTFLNLLRQRMLPG
ncbi:hypothetical protein BDN70DRAFT_989773, partial [Pholiota conissans]